MPVYANVGNGTVLAFPDGTSQAEVDEAVQRHDQNLPPIQGLSGAPVPGSIVTPGGGYEPDSDAYTSTEHTTPQRMLGETAAGMARPVNAVAGAAGLPTADPEQVYGVGPPRNEAERLGQAGGQAAGSSLMIATGAGAAGLGLDAIVGGTGGLADLPVLGKGLQWVRKGLGILSDHPVSAASAAGAGGVASQFTADSGGGLGAQVTAGLGGSLVYPYISPTMWAMRLGGPVYRAAKSGLSRLGGAAAGLADDAAPLAGSWMDRLAAASAQDTIHSTLSKPNFARAWAETQDLNEKLGLTQDSIFDIARGTGDPALLKKAAELNNTATGSTLTALTDRTAARAQGIQSYADRSGPVAVNEAPDTVLRTVQDTNTAAQNQATAEATGIAGDVPAVDRSVQGAQIRSQLLQLKQAEKTRLQALAQANGLNDKTITFDTDDLEKSLTAATQDMPTEKQTATIGYLRKLIGKTQATGPDGAPAVDVDGNPVYAPTSFARLQEARTQLGYDIKSALAGNAQSKDVDVRQMYLARQALDGYLDSAVPANAPPDLISRWRTWQQQWGQYRDTYENGQVYKATAAGGRSDYKTVDERVGSLFFGGNNETGPRQFLQAGGDPATLRAVALDSLNAAAVKNGQMQPALYQKWLGQNERSLRAAGLWDEFGNVQTVGTNLATRVNNLAIRQSAIEDDSLTKLIGMDPQRAVAAAMDDPVQMGKLVQVATKNNVMPALRRAVWQQALPNGEVSQAGDISAFLDRYKRTLPMVLDAQHIDALRTIDQALTRESRLGPPQGALPNADAIQQFSEKTGMSPMTVSSRLVNIAAGRLSPKVVFADMLARLGNRQYQNAYNNALTEALVNPSYARDFATGIKAGGLKGTLTGAAGKTFGSMLDNRLLALGVSPVRTDDQGRSKVSEQTPYPSPTGGGALVQ